MGLVVVVRRISVRPPEQRCAQNDEYPGVHLDKIDERPLQHAGQSNQQINARQANKSAKDMLGCVSHALSASNNRFQVSRHHALSSNRQSHPQITRPISAPTENASMNGPMHTAHAVAVATKVRYPRMAPSYMQTFGSATIRAFFGSEARGVPQ